MSSSRLIPTLLAIAALLAACVPSASRSVAASAERDRLTPEEITAQANAATALDVVRHLRPHWLRHRGPDSIRGSSSTLVVYVNEQRSGGVGALQQIRADAVRYMQYLSGPSATQRFGTNHGAGAILVTTR